ncbi:MAG: SsgA family sporulation/cell division regulator [Nocardioidaceae bacterium]
MSYDRDDPYAVTAAFSLGHQNVSWVFARSLLAAGQYAPTGDGDVVVRPVLDERGQAQVCLELMSPDGIAVLTTPAPEVQRFVRMTERLVPDGEESRHIDVDDAVQRILANA